MTDKEMIRGGILLKKLEEGQRNNRRVMRHVRSRRLWEWVIIVCLAIVIPVVARFMWQLHCLTIGG